MARVSKSLKEPAGRAWEALEFFGEKKSPRVRVKDLGGFTEAITDFVSASGSRESWMRNPPDFLRSAWRVQGYDYRDRFPEKKRRGEAEGMDFQAWRDARHIEDARGLKRWLVSHDAQKWKAEIEEAEKKVEAEQSRRRKIRDDRAQASGRRGEQWRSPATSSAPSSHKPAYL